MDETALGESSAKPALAVAGLSKTFPGTKALDDVDLRVMPGEVHALVGQNGSGKSTLIKVLAGYHRRDEDASITVYGKTVEDSDLRGGEQRLRFVHQDLGLFSELSVVDNIALRGDFIRNPLGTVSWRRQAAKAVEIIREFDPRINVGQNVEQLTPVQRTIVAIAAALASRTNEPMILVLDEPTAVLPREEVRELLEIVERLKRRGDSILYVSHRLDEVIQVADSVTVLRGGRVAASRTVTGLDTQSLAELMVGAEVDAHYRAEIQPPQTVRPVLEISGLQGEYLRDFTLTINAGEVIGIAGLPGSGREELPYLIAGYAKKRGGTVRLPDGRAVEPGTVPIIPASRLDEGIISSFTVKENVTLSFVSHLAELIVLSGRRERSAAKGWVDALAIKAGSIDADIASLSGGNQQKTVIARGLMRDPAMLVLSEPTAGVDVGARQAIYELLALRAQQGLAIVVSSTDIGDLLAICTKVLVLGNGEVTAAFDSAALNEKNILAAMETA